MSPLIAGLLKWNGRTLYACPVGVLPDLEWYSMFTNYSGRDREAQTSGLIGGITGVVSVELSNANAERNRGCLVKVNIPTGTALEMQAQSPKSERQTRRHNTTLPHLTVPVLDNTNSTGYKVKTSH